MHCCTCSGFCGHVGGPYFCAAHGGMQSMRLVYPQITTYPMPGTHLRGCPNVGPNGIGVCNCTGACRELVPDTYVGKHRKPV